MNCYYANCNAPETELRKVYIKEPGMQKAEPHMMCVKHIKETEERLRKQ